MLVTGCQAKADFNIIDLMDLAKQIKQKALRLGFDLVGITTAQSIEAAHVEALAGWLSAGCAGQMGYMHRNFEKRIDPAGLLKNAESVIIVGLAYKPPEQKAKPADDAAPMGAVASYARYQDYHIFIKRLLRKLIEFIASHTGAGLRFKICVDAAPVAERALAARAGLGFIGKNHMLTNSELGPQILLGEIITNLELTTDKPASDNCSKCDNKCVSACPTGALMPDGRFDANKCISYLTIEYQGLIPPEQAAKMGTRLFGCEECILACPYQKKAPQHKNKQFKFYNHRAGLDLQHILNLTPSDFEAEFADSPILRTGLERLKRNARICVANITANKS